MATTVIANFNNTPVSTMNQQYQSNPSKADGVDVGITSGFLSVLPQTSTLKEELLDNYCYSLHEDENLELFVELFKKVIEENAELFSSYDLQKKADILFDFHRKNILEQVSTDPQFSGFVKQVMSYLKDPSSGRIESVIKEKTLEILADSMIPLHTSFPSFAIGRALEICPSKVCFSTSVYPKENLKFSGSASIYKMS